MRWLIVGTGYFVWQLALFLSLGENFLHFGGALALAALVGAIAGMFWGAPSTPVTERA
ncbi:MAG: hypothetical protein WDM89_17745 [Rhizomicrobium sp.]